MTGVLLRGKKGKHTDIKGLVKTEAESVVMCPRAKDHLESPEFRQDRGLGQMLPRSLQTE